METPRKHLCPYGRVADTKYQTKDGCALLPELPSALSVSVWSMCVFLEGAIPSNIQWCDNNSFD